MKKEFKTVVVCKLYASHRMKINGGCFTLLYHGQGQKHYVRDELYFLRKRGKTRQAYEQSINLDFNIHSSSILNNTIPKKRIKIQLPNKIEQNKF